MDISELNSIFIENAIALRAIPQKVKHIFEKSHIDKYPDGKIQYLEEYKREMLVVERIPKNAGKFVIECVRNTDSQVCFSGKQYFDSIEDAIKSILEKRSCCK